MAIICCSVTKSCLTVCDPMDCSTPDFSLLHCLPEFAQTHVPWFSDAIQPSHSQYPPSLAFNVSQHQGFFQWVGSGGIMWPKYWSFSISPSNEYLGLISFRDWLVWIPCCSRDSQESSPGPQFESINSLTLNLLYGPTLTSVHDYRKTILEKLLEKP